MAVVGGKKSAASHDLSTQGRSTQFWIDAPVETLRPSNRQCRRELGQFPAAAHRLCCQIHLLRIQRETSRRLLLRPECFSEARRSPILASCSGLKGHAEDFRLNRTEWQAPDQLAVSGDPSVQASRWSDGGGARDLQALTLICLLRRHDRDYMVRIEEADMSLLPTHWNCASFTVTS